MTTLMQTAHLADEDVLDKIIAGEKALYEVVIRRYNPLLYKIGRSYGFVHEDAQDLMQDTYVSAYQNLPDFERRSQLGTWLARIMINKCLYKIKSQSRMKSYAFGENKNVPGDQSILQHELGKLLERAIEQLPENYRLVFLLREVQGLSVAETAAIMNITAVNVKVRLNRAKAQLQQYLEQWYSKADIYDFDLKYCTMVVEDVLKKVS